MLRQKIIGKKCALMSCRKKSTSTIGDEDRQGFKALYRDTIDGKLWSRPHKKVEPTLWAVGGTSIKGQSDRDTQLCGNALHFCVKKPTMCYQYFPTFYHLTSCLTSGRSRWVLSLHSVTANRPPFYPPTDSGQSVLKPAYNFCESDRYKRATDSLTLGPGLTGQFIDVHDFTSEHVIYGYGKIKNWGDSEHAAKQYRIILLNGMLDSRGVGPGSNFPPSEDFDQDTKIWYFEGEPMFAVRRENIIALLDRWPKLFSLEGKNGEMHLNSNEYRRHEKLSDIERRFRSWSAVVVSACDPIDLQRDPKLLLANIFSAVRSIIDDEGSFTTANVMKLISWPVGSFEPTLAEKLFANSLSNEATGDA